MSNRAVIILFFLAVCTILPAMPIWDITVYPTSTVAYGMVTIAGEPAEAGDIVYAFVHRECRGKQPVKVAEDKAIMTMNIQGLDDHEPVYFKIWDASADSVFEVNYTTFTKPNQDIGYPPDLLPINGVKEPIIFYFPPEELEMHPYEIRQLDVGFYCNTVNGVQDLRVFGNENLDVTPDGLLLNIAAISDWTGTEEIEVELLNDKGEVLNYGTTAIIVTP
ncbi:MAG: hypothetical protein K9N06_01915 [Candidatus Cloacimonetes bacterium]|nr:hypothetical protein [Candidatus Cloacimonadota bacterium]